ncbi:MAG: hypothetical protein FWG25_02715 [Promicromonosporaceae bacterium]|nr:hypothetical protein [Promicromonosporaceae bacterium]
MLPQVIQATNPHGREIVDIQAVCNRFGVSPVTVRRWETSGILRRVPMPPGRTGKPLRAVRFYLDDVRALFGGEQ